jgi:undecaprenyl phosphate-alpha-L-ara4FN deformylase
MKIGLRIDVDTWRGTREGVPQLLRVLKAHNIRATFFFSVGPDNMGRHIWRLLKPQFLIKMLRSNAPGLYGWDILLRGTFWPGPLIGKECAGVLRSCAEDGHEIGVHAWDHHQWQAKIDNASQQQISEWTRRACETLENATGAFPTCAASPGWKTTPQVLLSREEFPFQFNSDCRGETVFYPLVENRVLSQLQIPNTLPTYDEVIGQNGISDENYNAFLISQLRPDALNVLTIHAEVEGIARAQLFEDFLQMTLAAGHEFCALGALREYSRPDAGAPTAAIVPQVLAGREGWVAAQALDSESTL